MELFGVVDTTNELESFCDRGTEWRDVLFEKLQVNYDVKKTVQRFLSDHGIIVGLQKPHSYN